MAYSASSGSNLRASKIDMIVISEVNLFHGEFEIALIDAGSKGTA